jgi:ATP-dependent helicase/nuclease subunit A
VKNLIMMGVFLINGAKNVEDQGSTIPTKRKHGLAVFGCRSTFGRVATARVVFWLPLFLKDSTFTSMKLDRLKIISAGAGSGKTYRLTQEMVALLQSGQVKASGIIATTFTRKAAAELKERVRIKLLEDGLHTQADELTNALIGTVHGLGVKLLRRFAFAAGVSPSVDILPEEQQQQMFNQSLAAVLTLALLEDMDRLNDRLGLTKRHSFYDWRREVRQLVDIARANDFSAADLQYSREQSWRSFQEFLPPVDGRTENDAHHELQTTLQATIDTLEAGEDQTKKTATAVDKLRASLRELELRGYLHWHQWAALGKLSVGAKSRETIEPLQGGGLEPPIPGRFSG